MRIVLTSGYAEDEATHGFGDDDLAGFLRKPYGVRELLEQVRLALAT